MKSDKTGTVQYGVLPWRQADRLEVLLITSRETARWVIPKGWPIKGKPGPRSAAQEAFEEAGVEGDLDTKSIGAYPYLKRLRDGSMRPLQVEVFPLKVSRELPEWPEKDERQRRWFSLGEAAEAVDEPELGDIIRNFGPR